MKKEDKNFFVDKDIQVILGTMLRVGVVLSMTVVFIGGVLYLIHNGSHRVNYGTFHPDAAQFFSIDTIIKGLIAHQSGAIIQLGTLLLIFTPVTRVVFSIFSFLIERDYRYVLIGLFVLSVILFSLSNK